MPPNLDTRAVLGLGFKQRHELDVEAASWHTRGRGAGTHAEGSRHKKLSQPSQTGSGQPHQTAQTAPASARHCPRPPRAAAAGCVDRPRRRRRLRCQPALLPPRAAHLASRHLQPRARWRAHHAVPAAQRHPAKSCLNGHARLPSPRTRLAHKPLLRSTRGCQPQTPRRPTRPCRREQAVLRRGARPSPVARRGRCPAPAGARWARRRRPPPPPPASTACGASVGGWPRFRASAQPRPSPAKRVGVRAGSRPG